MNDDIVARIAVWTRESAANGQRLGKMLRTLRWDAVARYGRPRRSAEDVTVYSR